MDPDRIEMIKLYWEEFKYRHERYWKSFFRFSFAILFLLALPYVYSDKLDELGRLSILVPVLSAILSLFSAWLLAAEYERIRLTKEKFQELKEGKFGAKELEKSGIRKILSWRIGIVVTVLFVVVFFLLSLLELGLMLSR